MTAAAIEYRWLSSRSASTSPVPCSCSTVLDRVSTMTCRFLRHSLMRLHFGSPFDLSAVSVDQGSFDADSVLASDAFGALRIIAAQMSDTRWRQGDPNLVRFILAFRMLPAPALCADVDPRRTPCRLIELTTAPMLPPPCATRPSEHESRSLSRLLGVTPHRSGNCL